MEEKQPFVEQAQAEKGDRARLADRIARPLVPGVMILAVLVGALGSLLSGDPELWITRALVVLVDGGLGPATIDAAASPPEILLFRAMRPGPDQWPQQSLPGGTSFPMPYPYPSPHRRTS